MKGVCGKLSSAAYTGLSSSPHIRSLKHMQLVILESACATQRNLGVVGGGEVVHAGLSVCGDRQKSFSLVLF